MRVDNLRRWYYLADITERVIKEEVRGETGDVDEVDERRQIGAASKPSQKDQKAM